MSEPLAYTSTMMMTMMALSFTLQKALQKKKQQTMATTATIVKWRSLFRTNWISWINTWKWNRYEECIDQCLAIL